MTVLTHTLERTLVIRAAPVTVFAFLSDSVRWAAWWGAGSSIDARPGGRVVIRYPDGTQATGNVLEIEAPTRLAFTYGYENGTPIPPGGSRVDIRLERHAEGTRLRLVHAFADPAVRDQHVQGWRYQLSLFANLVASHVHAGAQQQIDRWFGVWNITDDRRRREALSDMASPDIEFRDRFSAIVGVEELSSHIAGAQRFMPGITLRRSGAVRHCQGMVLADWHASGAEGQPRGSGTNVFVFDPDGRLVSVTGFWN